MLNTLRATVTPAGTIVFEEAVDLTHPTAVLVTLLEEPMVEPKAKAEAEAPLSWQLTDEEKRVWDKFPEFRRQHPVNFNSMETTE